jgi:hypothetical protein
LKISDDTDLRVRKLLNVGIDRPKTGKFAGQKIYKSRKISEAKISENLEKSFCGKTPMKLS